MKRQDRNTISPNEKDRMRDEIDAQIREYLQKGGHIEVISENDIRRPPVGSVWDTAQDYPVVGE
jgi:hypothetical protein